MLLVRDSRNAHDRTRTYIDIIETLLCQGEMRWGIKVTVYYYHGKATEFIKLSKEVYIH